MRAVRRWAAGAALVLAAAAGLLIAAAVMAAPAAHATAALAEETGKDCTDCHITPGGPLTAEGERYLDGVPAEGGGDGEGGGSDGASDGGAEAEGDAAAGGPLLDLPGWLDALVQWVHLVGVVAWLGAIIFVHLIQSPTIAGRGIPSRYKALAWPAMGLVGLSGILLTLARIDAASLLTGTRWGAILLGKIGVYLLLVGSAFVATFLLSPRLKAMAGMGHGGQGGTGSSDDGAGGDSGDSAEDGHGRPDRNAALHQGYKEQGLVTVGYEGKIYDVTRSQLWSGGRHARRHDAWGDLTPRMAGAPHGGEVFEPFGELEASPVGARLPSFRVFLFLTYWNLGMVLLALLLVAAW